jgi:hypothetical protein
VSCIKWENDSEADSMKVREREMMAREVPSNLRARRVESECINPRALCNEALPTFISQVLGFVHWSRQ